LEKWERNPPPRVYGPTAAALPLPAGVMVTAVALGGTHSAYVTAGGALFVAGDQALPQGREWASLRPTELGPEGGRRAVPIVPGHGPTASNSHLGPPVLGNAFGQLGVGDIADRPQPTPVPVGGGQAVVRAALGAFHSAVLTANGALFVFGNNGEGAVAPGWGGGPFFPSGSQTLCLI